MLTGISGFGNTADHAFLHAESKPLTHACQTTRLSPVTGSAAGQVDGVSVVCLTLLCNDADQVGNSNANHPALSPSDRERVAEGRVSGKRNVHIVYGYFCDTTP